eukprot:2648991-Pleurochrysis_carterae.AAC.1
MLWRSTLQLLRTPTLVATVCAMGAAGALQGLMFTSILSSHPPYFHTYASKYLQCFFLLLLATTITAIQLGLPLFGSERVVFMRESKHFSVLAYSAGKFVAATPLTALYPLAVLLFWYQLVAPVRA